MTRIPLKPYAAAAGRDVTPRLAHHKRRRGPKTEFACFPMALKKQFGHIQIPLKRVHIELTNVCEFDCAFCPKSEMRRPKGYMDPELAKQIISDLARNRICEKITLHVMGEPMLHPDLSAVLAHAKSRGMPVGLTTNGAGLGGKRARTLLDHELRQMDVSFQTPDEASFGLRKSRHLDFDTYQDRIFDFFREYHFRHPNTIFKFRFLNTRFPCSEIEAKKGPIRVIGSTSQLRRVLADFIRRIYRIKADQGLADPKAVQTVLKRAGKVSSLAWNVLEVFPNVFFETYTLSSWGHAFENQPVKKAWAGYCFGMRDHFAILYNGDLVLCCMDFNGATKMGNLKEAGLKQILGSPRLGEIMKDFRRFQLRHPYCRRCLGSSSTLSWAVKPVTTILGLTLLKPLVYRQKQLYPKSVKPD